VGVKSCGEKVVAERLLVSGVMALGSGYLTFNLLKKLLLFYEIYNNFTKVKTKLMGNRLSIAPATAHYNAEMSKMRKLPGA
jgi:hypothetical protein